MKKLLISLVLSVVVIAPAVAEEPTCEAIERISALIMKNRQAGVSLTEALKYSDNKVLQSIVIDAYSQPAMQAPENALRQRTEFGVKWMLECIKNI